jgi:hypothetical protein
MKYIVRHDFIMKTEALRVLREEGRMGAGRERHALGTNDADNDDNSNM